MLRVHDALDFCGWEGFDTGKAVASCQSTAHPDRLPAKTKAAARAFAADQRRLTRILARSQERFFVSLPDWNCKTNSSGFSMSSSMRSVLFTKYMKAIGIPNPTMQSNQNTTQLPINWWRTILDIGGPILSFTNYELRFWEVRSWKCEVGSEKFTIY
jgi:hypothetical protein